MKKMFCLLAIAVMLSPSVSFADEAEKPSAEMKKAGERLAEALTCKGPEISEEEWRKSSGYAPNIINPCVKRGDFQPKFNWTVMEDKDQK